MLLGDAVGAGPVGDVRVATIVTWAGPWGPGVRPGQAMRVRARPGDAQPRATTERTIR